MTKSRLTNEILDAFLRQSKEAIGPLRPLVLNVGPSITELKREAPATRNRTTPYYRQFDRRKAT